MTLILGYIAMTFLAFAALPQFLEALRKKEAALNLNWGYLYCWFIGIILMSIYTHLVAGEIYPWPLQITNFISIFFSSGLIILKYIYTRQEQDTKKKNLNLIAKYKELYGTRTFLRRRTKDI